MNSSDIKYRATKPGTLSDKYLSAFLPQVASTTDVTKDN